MSVNSGGYLPRRSGSVNIHRYSPPFRRIIVKYNVGIAAIDIYNTVLVAAVCLRFLQAQLRVFNSCLLHFSVSRETEWLYILMQSSQQEWRIKIFSHLTFREQNSSQIIPRISFTVHFEFSAQHTVWMQCEKYCNMDNDHEVKVILPEIFFWLKQSRKLNAAVDIYLAA